MDGYNTEIGIFHGSPQKHAENIYTQNIGILIDMDKKICRFYDYDKKEKLEVEYKINGKYFQDFDAPIQFKKGVIFIQIKRGCYDGVTILNEGCIPIPVWVSD